MDTPHPYYPPTISLPAYVPNELPLSRTLSIFGGLAGAVVLAGYGLASRNARLRSVDRFAASWFFMNFFLHIFFEGYYVLHRTNISGMNTLLAQLWKEYTLSDSRYLTSDVFTVCIETISVVAWGPLSLLTFLSIVNDAPSRHVYQIVLCTAHIYGVTLYYVTNWTEFQFHGVSYSRPEFLYFWVYYVGFNAPWALVPTGLLVDSYRQVTKAFKALHAKDARKKGI